MVRCEILLPAGANAETVHTTVSLYSQTLPPVFPRGPRSDEDGGDEKAGLSGGFSGNTRRDGLRELEIADWIRD